MVVGQNTGGRGFSVFEAPPAYQQAVDSANQFSAVEYLTPTDYVHADGLVLPTAWIFNPRPFVTRGFGTGRATPDMSTDADSFTCYEVYDSQRTLGALESGWGGMSFVAQQLDGSAAVIDPYLGHRVGFWKPATYQFATTSNSPLTPFDSAETSNDNLYYSGTPGHICYVGSGLDYPEFAKLASDFAHA